MNRHRGPASPNVTDRARKLAPNFTTIAVLVLAALPYLPATGGDFVYDDVALCQEDPRVAKGDLVGAVRIPYWGEKLHGGLYRPVTTVSYVLNGLVSRRPLGFRLVNIALHVGATAVAIALARRILGSERAAFVAAAVFAVHPLHVEVAGNVVGRAESLGFVLGGAAWWLAVPAARARRLVPLLIATGLATLAVLSKENAVAVALGAPLELLFWSQDRANRERDTAGRRTSPPLLDRAETLALAVTPAAVAVALALAARIAALGTDSLTPGSKGIPYVMNPLVAVAPGARIANAPLLFLEYASHFVWPLGLAPDYGGFYLPLARSLPDPRVIGWAIAALVLLAAPAFISRRRARELAFGSLFALLALAPVLQLVTIGTLLGDRLAYAASFGWSLLVGVAADALARRLSPIHKLAGRLLVAGLIGGLAAIATADAWAWRANIPLFERAYARTHGTLQIPLVLASYYLKVDDYEKARAPLQEAVRLNPDDGGPHLLLGNLERLGGRYRIARSELERGLALPHQPEDDLAAHYDLGFTLVQLGDLRGAEREFATACRIAPGDAKSYSGLGGVLHALKEYDRACVALEKSLALEPQQEQAAKIRVILEKSRRHEP